MGDAQKRATHAKGISRMLALINSDQGKSDALEMWKVRLERLEEMWSDFKKEHMEIVEITVSTDEDAIELNETIMSSAENDYMLAKATVCHRLNELRKPQSVGSVGDAASVAEERLNSSNDDAASVINSSNDSSHDDENPSIRQSNSILNPNENITISIPNLPSGGVSQLKTGLRLQQQDIPVFNGDYSQWLEFRDLYMPMVHNDRMLLPIAKFNALVRHLRGPAADLIAGIQVSDANYPEAWELIQKTYDDKRMITQALVRKLRELKPLTSESAPGLHFIVIRFRQILRQLRTLGVSVDQWDVCLLVDLIELLDRSTKTALELKQLKRQRNQVDDMNLADTLDWLENRARSAMRFDASSNSAQVSQAVASQSVSRNASKPRIKSVVGHVSIASSSAKRCPMCKEDHLLEDCPKFLALNPYPRTQRVKSFRLCFGCLSDSHMLPDCKADFCKHCSANKKHHRLLCFEYCDKQREKSAVTVGFLSTISEDRSPANLALPFSSGSVLLATALVDATSPNGHTLVARALCDTGGQANLISEEFVNALRLQRHALPISVSPVGDATNVRSRGFVELTITSRHPGGVDHPEWLISYRIRALIMRKVSPDLPSSPVDIGDWPEEVATNLADPTLREPGQIDLLLGAHVWSRIALPNLANNELNGLLAQSTRFGWLIFGGLVDADRPTIANVMFEENNNDSLSSVLQTFFELEDVSQPKIRSKEEEMCEQIFVDKLRRADDGRYIAPIPLKPDHVLLGESRGKAFRRLLQNERKFRSNPKYRENYIAFMEDFIEQGHMTLLKERISTEVEHFYVPHHGIDNGKFRTVFDGSAITSSGVSFNDIQLKGERLQDNLDVILLRFRLHEIALTADIKQMYRQVIIDESQRHYQIVLWRHPDQKDVQEYVLNRVTYGMKHALHTAVRAMQQCAEDGKENYPMASSVAKRDFYVDDLTTGTDTVNEAVDLYHQMNDLMATGGFKLCKWATSSWAVAAEMKTENTNSSVEFNLFETRSVLGVKWDPNNDEFQFVLNEDTEIKSVTKRSITGEIAKLFDPTGLLSPVILCGKILIRDLWISKLKWDEPLPSELLDRWLQLRDSLKAVEKVRVPRWIGTSQIIKLELHGFADACELAYGAVIYYRVVQENNHVRCGVLASKTKVAPIKVVSIPRLELCAALLLAQLMVAIQSAYESRVTKTTYWTDSTIAIAWISQSPHQLKTFVANRVAKIQRATNDAKWNHVRSQDNPADLASRGAYAPELIDNRLWWSGPDWLKLSEEHWPQSCVSFPADDQKAAAVEHKSPVIAQATISEFWIANRYSDISRLFLVTAFIKRFIRNVREAVNRRKEGQSKPKRLITFDRVEPLSRDEWLSARNFWFGKMQQFAFRSEIERLKADSQLQLHKNSKLIGLKPFLDQNGLLRVSGRLGNSNIAYDQKHPIILPGDSPLVKRMIFRQHLMMYHGGVAVTTASLRNSFWIIGGRNAIRHEIHKCLECTRHRKETLSQLMAPLVSSRVNVSRPFTHVSVDYCGPFEVKRFSGRCKTKVKVYVIVFICMSTRAIHLQVVEDMTTSAFLDGYQQMAARRGHPLSITSDNAKYFLGGKRRIDQVLQTFRDCAHSEVFTTRGIEWKFIMPRSPSQGGSHEAAVKLFKYHLKRMMKTYTLSVSEFTSLTIRIESCLNSRPLVAMCEDAGDPLPLTPAHFIIHGPFEQVAIDPPVDEQQSLASKWLKLQHVHQSFWHSWKTDYLNSLANRDKWKLERENLKVGDVVLLKEDFSPPQHWPLGIVAATHPGKDGLVRNVTLKLRNGNFQRAVQQLVRLPFEDCESPAIHPGQDVEAAM